MKIRGKIQKQGVFFAIGDIHGMEGFMHIDIILYINNICIYIYNIDIYIYYIIFIYMYKYIYIIIYN